MSAITDSDIQFLGNWNSQQPTSTPSIVSAIVLTPMNPNPGASPLDLTRTFCRSQTSVVHVGRTPALDASVPVDDRVTFLNPVMSRNHAKITFADSGSVFIIDTNSHHGTCISRSLGQFKLASESPFQLQDGDKITFGKDVLRNGLLHKPLTVSVKLLRTTSTPSSMSISSTSVSPIGKTSSPRSRNRFGLSPASDSEDSSDSPANQNGNENDLLPCTGSNAIVLDISESDTSSFPTSSDDSSLVSPSGLELEGINMLADVASPSSSSTPPWRRLGGGSPWPTSFFDRMPDILQQPPRNIGRLLTPFWTRGTGRGCVSRARKLADGHAITHGHDHIHALDHAHEHGHTRSIGYANDWSTGRLDADWGIYGQSGSTTKGLSERIDSLKKDMEKLQNSGDSDHTRLEDILNNKLPQIATISADLDTLQSHQSALQADVRSLRSGLTEVGGHVGDVRRDVEGMKKDIEGMREDVMEIEREGGVVREEMEGVQLELGNLKQDVGVMEIGVGRQADGEKQDTTAVPTDEDLRARIKEELRTLIAQDIELPSLARKRKHDDLEFDSNSGLPTPAVLPTSVTSDRLLRPRKRLRLVANCAAAGVVGALGAWLGLAFL